MVKTFKNLLQNQRANDLGHWYVALGQWAHQIYSKNDSRLTLTYFTARSNLVSCFYIRKTVRKSFNGRNLQQMTRMTTGLCFYKNCDPKGLCASVPGLYTCIKTWKIMYKVRLQKYVFDTCSKWAKWQNFSVDIRILSILGCRPLPRGYISPRWISRQLRRDQLFLQVRIEWFLLSTHIF